jgi:diacylglycerol kinase family enzyme
MTGQQVIPRDRHKTVPLTARWLARLAVVALVSAIVVLVLGDIRSLVVILVAVAASAVALAGGWLFLSRRGPLRWFGAALAVGAPVAVLVLYVVRNVFWAVVVVVVLVALAAALGQAALTVLHPAARMTEHPAQPVRHPYLLMNPRSGGGKVGRFDLVAKARAQGAEVELLEGPGPVDVGALARHAVDNGADLLGVAGGDGTQAIVAGIAAAHSQPFLVVSAGTRNHFAMDLGLDRDHPDLCLDALTDPVELDIDLGEINGRTFVNNASFGAYAEVVQSPAYRDDKRGTTLRMLPDLLSGHSGPRLTAQIDGELTITGPQALLVSNNPYDFDDLAGLGRRTRLDAGVLGVVAVTVDNLTQAVGLIRGRHSTGVRRLTAREVIIDADADEIAVGIDGEALRLPTPVRCTLRAKALRVRVPRSRPGIPTVKAGVDPAAVLRATVGRV